MINKIKIFSNNNMIRKEEVDVRELNRKVHARAQLKPDLDAFPVKEFSVPFNSLKNRHGILNAELETPESFRDESLGGWPTRLMK